MNCWGAEVDPVFQYSRPEEEGGQGSLLSVWGEPYHCFVAVGRAPSLKVVPLVGEEQGGMALAPPVEGDTGDWTTVLEGGLCTFFPPEVLHPGKAVGGIGVPGPEGEVASVGRDQEEGWGHSCEWVESSEAYSLKEDELVEVEVVLMEAISLQVFVHLFLVFVRQLAGWSEKT